MTLMTLLFYLNTWVQQETGPIFILTYLIMLTTKTWYVCLTKML